MYTVEFVDTVSNRHVAEEGFARSELRTYKQYHQADESERKKIIK